MTNLPRRAPVRQLFVIRHLHIGCARLHPVTPSPGHPVVACLCVLCASAVITFCGAAAADTVVRRGSEPSIEGTLVSVDDSGVHVVSALGATHKVPWDRIRSVESTQMRDEITKMLPIAEDLWRARSRLERLDTTLAEPLFEKLFERYRGRTHETALVVAEGLLRCRLAHGEHELAVVTALETARLRRAGIVTQSFTMLDEVIDGERSLCPKLAPAWRAGPLLHRVRDELSGYDAQGDEVIAAIAWKYEESILAALGVEEVKGESLPRHPGVALLESLNQCVTGKNSSRRAAAERLANQIPTLPAWAESWARYHIGLALVQQDDAELRDRGVVQLLHLPARFARTQPWLADLALRQAADALEAAGDSQGATTLRRELPGDLIVRRTIEDAALAEMNIAKEPR